MNPNAKYLLDKYEEMELIAKSQKNSVYIIKDKISDRILIKKILPKQSNIDTYRRIQEYTFKNTPKIHAIIEHDDNYIIIEEYISGMSLRQKLDKNDTLESSQAIKYTLRLCEVLNQLHSLDPPIIHRDIKPSNIIISDSDMVYLIDFDISRTYKAYSEADTLLIGTKQYASPEQYGFKQTDCRSDIYSIGVLMAEMLTGKTIPQNTNYKEYGKLKGVIKKCTKVDARLRYQNLSKLIKDLKRFENPLRVVFKLIKTFLILISIILLLILAFTVANDYRKNNVLPDLNTHGQNGNYIPNLLKHPLIEKKLKTLLTEDYNYFIECMDMIDWYYDNDNQSVVLYGGVRGLYTIMEGILEIKQNGLVYVGFLKDGYSYYYTNDLNETAIIHSGLLPDWFKQARRPVIFKNAELSVLQFNYEDGDYFSDFGAVLALTFNEGGATFEGHASIGADIGEVAGEILIDSNYAVYDDGNGNKLYFMFAGNDILVSEDGVFGGFNVTFDGVYQKK